MNAIIGAFLLVFLAAFSGGTNAFAGTDAPVATAVTIATDKTEIQAHDDAQSQSKMAAVDRAEPLAKSPTLAAPFGLNAVPVADGELLTNWSRVEADIRAENEILAQCRENIVRCPLGGTNLPRHRRARACPYGPRAHRRDQPRDQSRDPPSERPRTVGSGRPLDRTARDAHDRLWRLRGLRHREIRCAYGGWSRR